MHPIHNCRKKHLARTKKFGQEDTKIIRILLILVPIIFYAIIFADDSND